MAKYNANNERIKRRYLTYLKEAKRHSEATIDAVAAALARFEADTGYRDFKTFRHEQAIAFKRHLAEQHSQKTGKRLSKATMHATLSHVKRFFEWLLWQPGYRSRLHYDDPEYFNLSEKDTRIAKTRRDKPYPTIEQIKHVISVMPCATEIERRDRALIAFTLLTGARDGAIASFKLKHIDIAGERVYQDAREVKTKFSKSFDTYFFPVGDDIRQIVAEWFDFLRNEKLWGVDAPLFPATKTALGEDHRFEPAGLKPEHWRSAAPIRKVFRSTFEAAGLPYFNPHSFRQTLVRLGEEVCMRPEDFKAWSQNLGHESVLTTLYSYGEVPARKQGEIIRRLASPNPASNDSVTEIARAVVRELASNGQLRQTK